MYVYTYLHTCIYIHTSVRTCPQHSYYILHLHICIQRMHTGWRRLIGSPKLQIIFHKRATKYRSLLRKMTHKDKGSYESSPPCMPERTEKEDGKSLHLLAGLAATGQKKSPFICGTCRNKFLHHKCLRIFEEEAHRTFENVSFSSCALCMRPLPLL